MILNNILLGIWVSVLTDKSQGYTEAAFHPEVSKTVFESLTWKSLR